jgi:TP901 family phage tail tape measure protein
MAAESNVGARLFLIGKDGVLAGLREMTAATADLNAEIAAGAKASKTAAAGYTEQGAGLEALQVKMDVYQAQLGAVNAETDALARVGKVAFYTLAAAGAAWTYESIKWAQNYQTALVQLRTQAGLTVTAMNQIGTAAMRNAASLGISPIAYLQAAYHPASTGFGVAESIAITNYGAKLAAIGGASPEDTVNSLTSTMKAFGFGTGQTEHTAALLNAIVGSGNMHWSDLNSALASGIASTSKTFGVSLSSMGGALARMTDLGTPAAQAGTRLRMALALLGAPTQESDKLLTAAGLDTTQATAASSAMASALTQAGLTTTQLSAALRNNSGAGGIYNALNLLHSTLTQGGLSPEAQSALLSRAFGGGRMGTSIMQLYSNLPALAAKSGQIDKGSTNKKFMSDWAATTATLNFQLHRLGAELETLGTAFGKDVLPYVTDGIKIFTDFLGIVTKNKALVMLLGGAITAILVPAIGVYLKRALVSSEGSIMAVLNAYKRLILGQSAEDAALERMDGALAVNTRALRVNAGAAGTDDAAGIPKVLPKAAPAVVGAGGAPLLSAAAWGATAYATGRDLKALLGKAKPWDPLHVTKYLRGSEINHGIAVGYDVDRHVAAHGLDIARHQIASTASNLWHDIDGGGGTKTLPRGVIRNQVYVYIDGKQVTASVKSHVRKAAARK